MNHSSSWKILISYLENESDLLLESIIVDAPIKREPRLINTDRRRAPHRRSLGTGKNRETSSTGFVPLQEREGFTHETCKFSYEISGFRRKSRAD